MTNKPKKVLITKIDITIKIDTKLFNIKKCFCFKLYNSSKITNNELVGDIRQNVLQAKQ